MGKLMVYVAGPISTGGDYIGNIRRGIQAGEELRKIGFVPFVPHLSAWWELVVPLTWNDWLEYDEEIIRRCDALLRLPGESRGADREVAFAAKHGIPVFHSAEKLGEWRDWMAEASHA